MATKVVATATVRAINRKLQPTRAAIVLVMYFLIILNGGKNCDIFKRTSPLVHVKLCIMFGMVNLLEKFVGMSQSVSFR